MGFVKHCAYNTKWKRQIQLIISISFSTPQRNTREAARSDNEELNFSFPFFFWGSLFFLESLSILLFRLSKTYGIKYLYFVLKIRRNIGKTIPEISKRTLNITINIPLTITTIHIRLTSQIRLTFYRYRFLE